MARFGITRASAAESATLATNPDLYGGLLTAGLVWSLLLRAARGSLRRKIAELHAIAWLYRRDKLRAPERFLDQIRAALSGRDFNWALLN